jgi:hypothetical protein
MNHGIIAGADGASSTGFQNQKNDPRYTSVHPTGAKTGRPADEEAASKAESYCLDEKITYDSTHRTLKPRHIQLIGMAAYCVQASLVSNFRKASEAQLALRCL